MSGSGSYGTKMDLVRVQPRCWLKRVFWRWCIDKDFKFLIQI